MTTVRAGITTIITPIPTPTTDRPETRRPRPGRSNTDTTRISDRMGHWGVKSYENDGAADAIDAGMERVHGGAYDALMDDRNPLGFDQAQQRLANAETLAAAVESLREEVGPDVGWDDWDEEERLAFAGVVVRHAEFGVAVPAEWLDRAVAWLEGETIEWDEATVRRLRRQNETHTLKAVPRQDPTG